MVGVGMGWGGVGQPRVTDPDGAATPGHDEGRDSLEKGGTLSRESRRMKQNQAESSRIKYNQVETR